MTKAKKKKQKTSKQPIRVKKPKTTGEDIPLSETKTSRSWKGKNIATGEVVQAVLAEQLLPYQVELIEGFYVISQGGAMTSKFPARWTREELKD